MEFKRARNATQFKQRELEIINSCRDLCNVKDFEDITLKEIASNTSVSRTSLYNYYKTKEEVFLDLLQIEYLEWGEELNLIIDNKGIESKMIIDDLCNSICKRSILLKLLSVHLTQIENQCELESLVEFKSSVNSVFLKIDELIIKLEITNEQAKNYFMTNFLMLIFGLYPLTNLSEKQKQASQLAGVAVKQREMKEVCQESLFAIYDTAIQLNN